MSNNPGDNTGQTDNQQGYVYPPPPTSDYNGSRPPLTPEQKSEAASKKLAAGLCGILLGSLGVHKFVLGYTTEGLIELAVTLFTCGFGAAIMHPIGIIEGIIYLTKSDEDFYYMYMAQKKAWF